MMRTLVILDIPDPKNVFQLSQFNESEGVLDVVVKDNTAYLLCVDVLSGDWAPSFKIVDVSQTPPIRKGRYTLGSEIAPFSSTLTIDGSNLYVATYFGFSVFDVSDLTQPQKIRDTSTYDFIEATCVVIQEEIAYAATQRDGLIIYDVSDPSNPDQIGYLDTYKYLTDIFLLNGLAFVGSEIENSVIIDVSDPFNPELFCEIIPIKHIETIFVNSNYIYGGSSDGLVIFYFEFDQKSSHDGQITSWVFIPCIWAFVVILLFKKIKRI